MKKKLFLCAVLMLSSLSVFGQKRLQISEKNMSGVIFREAGDNETVVEVQSNVPLEFESTMDKQVNVYEKKQEGGFFYYKLKFPTGADYKGRRLTIKSYGFLNYDYPLELQTKVSVGLLVSDPDIKVEMDIITLKNSNVIFALVQEVGMEDIKYKRYDNPTGPTYVMKKSDTYMIRYINGTSDIFQSESTPPPVTDTSLRTNPSYPSSDQNGQRHPAEPEMVFVEGGAFWMGCTDEQGKDCRDNERPLHNVTVSSFYIGKYEITQKQWQILMGKNPSQQKGDDHPVENISWDEAQEFINRLNVATGKKYRLPTEAEWEYAARGGKKSMGYRYSGSNFPKDVAWYEGRRKEKTHPVGKKQPNELGIFDMSGNVQEWCHDWYDRYYSNVQTNPSGPLSGSDRVLRGGKWDSSEQSCRVSSRSRYSQKSRGSNDYFGFRIALSN